VITSLLNLLSFFAILLTVAATLAVIWFVYAVGMPLRRWLERDLADGRRTPIR